MQRVRKDCHRPPVVTVHSTGIEMVDGCVRMVSPLPEGWSAPHGRPPLNPRRTGSSTLGLWEVWSSHQHQMPKSAHNTQPHEGSKSPKVMLIFNTVCPLSD